MVLLRLEALIYFRMMIYFLQKVEHVRQLVDGACHTLDGTLLAQQGLPPQLAIILKKKEMIARDQHAAPQ